MKAHEGDDQTELEMLNLETMSQLCYLPLSLFYNQGNETFACDGFHLAVFEIK